MSGLNWLDIVIAAAVAGGALTGLNKGLVRLMFALVGVVAGVIFAGQNYRALAQTLSFIQEPEIANLAAYFTVFFAVFFIAGVVGEVLHATVGLLVFGCFDQVLGLSLGALVAALVVQAALLPLARFPLAPLQEALAQSTLAPLFISAAPILLALLPPEFDIVRKLF